MTADRRPRPVGLSAWWLLAVAIFVGTMVLYAVGAARGHGTGWGLVVAPVLAALAAPLVLRAGRLGLPFDLPGMLACAIAVKFLAVLARFEMVNTLYNGGDSVAYDLYGKRFAPLFRRLDFGVDPERPVPGTGFLRILTGVVYAIFGSDMFVGFLVFGMMSLLGCWFFFRALLVALPDADHRRYALLMFFWPTLTFWPSAIGKEAWMLLALGLTSLGAARLYRHQAHGFPLLALGITASAMPRPHIAVVVLAASAVGLVLGGTAGRSATVGGGFFVKLAGAFFFLVVGALLAPKLATFLEIDDIGGSGFDQALDRAVGRTGQGGSAFEPASIGSPLDYPWAFITVLFRPFLHEANNIASLVGALEGLALFGLLAWSIRGFIRLPGALVRSGYVAYCAAFAFMFVYVFAFIANFGILTRQRAQLLPFVFVIACLPAVARRTATDRRRRPVTIDLRGTVPTSRAPGAVLPAREGAAGRSRPAPAPRGLAPPRPRTGAPRTGTRVTR